MKSFEVLLIGVFLSFLFLVALISSLPPSQWEIPVNSDITVRLDDTNPRIDIKKHTPEKNNKVTKINSAASKTQEQANKLIDSIENVNKLLEHSALSAASMKQLISTWSTHRNEHCISIQEIKIEEITPYLRSPKWYNSNGNAMYIEDRSYLNLLANHYVPSSAPRKIYLDLGAAGFDSSVGWFYNHYPLTFDEVYAFEAKPNVFQIPPRQQIGGQLYDSIHFYQVTVGTQDNKAKNVLDFAKWMQETLKPSVEDFVVLKMDVEGAEWGILEHMEQTGVAQVIDELFVEIHYQHPNMSLYGWDAYVGHTQEDAFALLSHWRELGVYAHYWP